MEKDWELAYTVNNLQSAEIIRNILVNNEIQAIVLNKKDSFYLIGDVEIYVQRDHILRAKQIIDKLNL